MLRYVFDSVEQVQRHLHRQDGATLLFFPEPAHNRTGDPVMFEMQLRERDQQVVLRATIHSRVHGRQTGVWLQFSDQLSRQLDLDAGVIHRRRSPRIGSDVMVQVRTADASSRIARMTDVSDGGAKLASAQLKVGTAVDVHLLSPMREVPRLLGRAQVVRAAGGDVGLQFEPDASGRVHKLVQALAASWKAAVTVEHRPSCCEKGPPLEPPLPHARG